MAFSFDKKSDAKDLKMSFSGSSGLGIKLLIHFHLTQQMMKSIPVSKAFSTIVSTFNSMPRPDRNQTDL
ncbi:MAG: hypothetical protein IPI12_03560 [Ignavibacteriales bacterium]|nr:hypothetical protein [Ignavibacteriales bacterium]